MREGRRSAFGVVHAIMGQAAVQLSTPAFAGLTQTQKELWHQALRKGLNAPVTSSAGRLFDAVAALAGLRQVSTYEGQAAMELEWAVDPDVHEAYPWQLVPGGTAAPNKINTIDAIDVPPLVADWAPAIEAVLMDVAARVPVGSIAARWHHTMAEVIVTVARTVGRQQVVLSGGCFQNACLCELVDRQLKDAGLVPHWHQRVPPNDGGIALGQLMALVHPRQMTTSSLKGTLTCV